MNPDEGVAAPGESLTSLLGQLHDIHEPPAVSLWPGTTASWILVGVFVLALAAMLWRFRLHRKRNAYRREALRRLHGITPALVRGTPDALVELEGLIRRTALAAYPRSEVASLTGATWVAFLDRTGGHKSSGFAAEAPWLADAPYARPVSNIDGTRLAALARDWIRCHHA